MPPSSPVGGPRAGANPQRERRDELGGRPRPRRSSGWACRCGSRSCSAASAASCSSAPGSGETVFATGGGESSALLLGLPVARTKIAVYTASGMPAGFAGVLTAAYLQSGVTVIGVGTELDAIAAVVIGGTL